MILSAAAATFFCRISEGTFRPRETYILDSLRPLGPWSFAAGSCRAAAMAVAAAAVNPAAAVAVRAAAAV